MEPASSPRVYQGTSDQYEVGDLSGKFGTLDNRTTYKNAYNDSLLTLFGPRSILGRSVVIHKKVQYINEMYIMLFKKYRIIPLLSRIGISNFSFFVQKKSRTNSRGHSVDDIDFDLDFDRPGV